MQEKTWEDCFDEDPDEEIGRFVKGVFGEDVKVIMPRISWAYLDWLKEHQKANLEKFFSDCEAVALSENENRNSAYQNTVYEIYLQREKDNLPQPDWCLSVDLLDFGELEIEG